MTIDLGSGRSGSWSEGIFGGEPADVDETASSATWTAPRLDGVTLKTKGYNLEHNFGHGKKHLSAVLATLNLLAFAFHTVAELTYDLWLQALEADRFSCQTLSH